MIAFILGVIKILGEWFAPLLTAPKVTGRISSGSTRLEATPDEKIDARLRRAGLLLCVASVLGGCGFFERPKEVILAIHYPVEDWPDGVPILAETEVRVMLKDGTIGVLKDCEGMQLWHPSDIKGILKRQPKPTPIPPLDDKP